MLNIRFYNINFFLLLLTIALIVPKWIYSFYLFPDEDFLIKILSETRSIPHYPLANNISDFNFKPFYDPSINENAGILGFPILNLIIISLFWKLFGPLGFVLIELLSVFIFLKIFSNIIQFYTSSKSFTIFIGIFLLSIPFYLEFFAALNIEILYILDINFSSFYSFRFPRPVISNLFLFAYIYICHLIFIRNENTLKNYLLLGLISGLSVNVFYYFFIIQNLFLAILFIGQNKINFFNSINEKKKEIFLYLLLVIIFLVIYLTNLNFADSDYISRLGITSLDVNKKKILLNYTLNFLQNKYFLIVFAINILGIFYLKKKLFNFLVIFFIATILSPIVFFIISNKIITPYHFFNWIIISGFLNVIVFFFYFANFILNQNIKKIVCTIYIISTVLFMNLYLINYNLTNFTSDKRAQRSDIINMLKLDNFKDKKILVTDEKVFIWLAMNDYDNFSYVPFAMFTVRSSERIKQDFINVLKFFNLKSSDYEKILQSKIVGYRMENFVIKSFLGRKYIANSLTTFEDSRDFDDIKFIEQLKPSISHSFAIPNYEIKRLVNEFTSFKSEINPEIMILEKKHSFLNINALNTDNYCIIKENSSFIIYKKNSC
jgi:hypothetical protein